MPKRRPRPAFNRNRAPRSRLADWWFLWRVPILALIVMAVWWFGFRPMEQAQDQAEEAAKQWTNVTARFALCARKSPGGPREEGCVVDGDTVVIGFGPQRRRIRLIGFDTPELDGACEAEITLANNARLRLHQWLGEGAFEWSGGDDPPRDQYGRELREVRRISATGEDTEFLADMMVENGLAKNGGRGARADGWCG